jgi:hypothetical protein
MKRKRKETWVIGPQTRSLSQAWRSAERKGLTPLSYRQSLVDLQRQRDRLVAHERRLTIDLHRALRSGQHWRIRKLDTLRADCQARCSNVLVEIARRLDQRERNKAAKARAKAEMFSF